MAHRPKIDQNFAPSKVAIGGISPQAITRVFSVRGSKIRAKKP